ncbi:hypothetical protein AX16_005420 [Volvariella volvacea WC 439]|nr:hypothetical protein AX16_005420 [Volvariella volvacea WC 439]
MATVQTQRYNDPITSPILTTPTHTGIFSHGSHYAQELRPSAPRAQAQNRDVTIAVMGATGSGKSSFINAVSGSNLPVSDSLHSCTSKVQISRSFELDGRIVTLIDTPGFDDSSKSDAEVLTMISTFLAATYEQGKTLSGLLYFHRISDRRMGGISSRNIRMFRKLCGDDTLKNVVIVTNMWGEVSKEVGEAREKELCNEPNFFKGVLDKGAQMRRHFNTKESAEDVLRSVIKNHPLSLCIQREIVDQGKDISKTAAGAELNADLLQQIERQREEIRQLQAEMKDAIRQKDEETKRELEYETRKLQEEMNKVQDSSRRLEFDYHQEKLRMDERLRQVAADARRETETVSQRYERQIQELRDRLHFNNTTSAMEKEDILRKINSLQQSRASYANSGLFVVVGRALDLFFGY